MVPTSATAISGYQIRCTHAWRHLRKTPDRLASRLSASSIIPMDDSENFFRWTMNFSGKNLNGLVKLFYDSLVRFPAKSRYIPDIFQLGTQVDPNLVGDSHPMLQIVVTMDANLIAKIHRISGPCCTVSFPRIRRLQRWGHCSRKKLGILGDAGNNLNFMKNWKGKCLFNFWKIILKLWFNIIYIGIFDLYIIFYIFFLFWININVKYVLKIKINKNK